MSCSLTQYSASGESQTSNPSVQNQTLPLSSDLVLVVRVLFLFLIVPWVGLQCVIVAFPGHTHFS